MLERLITLPRRRERGEEWPSPEAAFIDADKARVPVPTR